MMRADEMNYSLQNLLHRRTRSFLTVLSILIGVMAIFAIVSFGLGIRNYVNTLAEDAGVDKLLISPRGVGAPGSDTTFKLTKDDMDFVLRINGVKEASGVYARPIQVTHGKESKYTYMLGYDLDKQQFVLGTLTVEIFKGRDLKKGDVDKVVLGYNYQIDDKVFKRGLKLGDKLTINSRQLEVIGFYNELGNPQDDMQVYTDFATMEQIYPDIKDNYAQSIAQAQPGVSAKELSEKISEKLRKHKGEEKGKETFFVQTFQDALATFSTIITILNGILGLIALISLVVASVNIMNTMYTAVIERTKEIGIMKSIGARNSDILFIFIFEAGLLGATGGILGVIFGFLIASTGGAIAAASGFSLLKPLFPWYLTLGCIFFSFCVGAAAGVLPALQASKLKPVDALRYE